MSHRKRRNTPQKDERSNQRDGAFPQSYERSTETAGTFPKKDECSIQRAGTFPKTDGTFPQRLERSVGATEALSPFRERFPGKGETVPLFAGALGPVGEHPPARTKHSPRKTMRPVRFMSFEATPGAIRAASRLMRTGSSRAHPRAAAGP